MKRAIGWGVAIMLAFGVAGLAFGADAGAKADKSSTKTGAVTKVDVDGKKLMVMVSREMTFTINAETKIVQGDMAKTLADIKVGDTVSIDYTRADQETRVATKVAIAAPAAAPVPNK